MKMVKCVKLIEIRNDNYTYKIENYNNRNGEWFEETTKCFAKPNQVTNKIKIVGKVISNVFFYYY